MKRFLAVLAMWVPAWAWGFSMLECYFMGGALRDAGHDYIPKDVESACRARAMDIRAKALLSLRERVGQQLSSGVSIASSPKTLLGSDVEITIKNDAMLAVSFLRVSVSPMNKQTGKCVSDRRSVFAYEMHLSPTTEVRIVYPDETASPCVSILDAYGKPFLWTDTTMLPLVRPLERDPIREFMDEHPASQELPDWAKKQPKTKM